MLTCTRNRPQTPTASIYGPTHHSILMLSVCFPFFACHSPVTVWILMRKISRPSFFLVINSICCFMVLWEWQRQAIPHYKIKSKKKIQFVVQQTLQMSWAQGVQSCQEIHKSSWTLEVMDMCLLLLASCVHRCSVSTNPSSQCQVTVASLRGWGGQTVSWPCLTISSFFS